MLCLHISFSGDLSELELLQQNKLISKQFGKLIYTALFVHFRFALALKKPFPVTTNYLYTKLYTHYTGYLLAMATYTDINSFDWSIVNDQLQPRSMIKQEVQPNNEDIWFDKFLDESEQQQQVQSNTTTATGSPLEFSSLFDADNDQPSQPQSLFTSTVTSLSNSPMVKAEEVMGEIPSLDLGSASRSDSIDSVVSDDSNDSETPTESTSSNSKSSTATDKKQKKKRAPRKRLTPHQKQAHNKIEKRYRININAKIAGLQQIIPWVASEKTAFETGDGEKPESETDVPRLNKSMILEKATSYILYLQESEDKMKIQLEKLRKEVERLGGNPTEL